ncbi:MAG: glycosyltransferase family 1 protein [Cyanophyceae cyanobacterium]
MSPPLALISVHGDPAAEIGREEAGGQNVYVRAVGEALARRGWRVDMFTRWVNPTDDREVWHGPHCRTVRLAAGPVEFIPRDRLFDHLPTFVDQWLAWTAQHQRRYDLIHSNYWLSSWVGMELAATLGIPQVHTYHSIGAVKYGTAMEGGAIAALNPAQALGEIQGQVSDLPAVARRRLAVERRCLEQVDCVVATSPQEMRDLRSLVSAAGRIQVVPCGTDIARFGQADRAVARQRLRLDSQGKLVLYVGRFDRRKGLETFLAAIAACQHRHDPAFRAIIGGGSRPGQIDDAEQRRIQSLVAVLDLGDVVQFTGRISDEDLPLYYAAADACVVPSYYEPFGLVAVEAMASRTPAIVSDVGGLSYSVLDGETGLRVPPRNELALAAAIDTLLRQPTLRDRLGATGRDRVEQYFSWEGVAEQLDHLYRSLLTSHPEGTLEPVQA